MGLDIRLYTEVKLAESKDKITHEDGMWGYVEDLECEVNLVVLQGNEHFKNHFMGADGVYYYKDHHTVISMSYGGYSRFRNALAKAAGYEKATRAELYDAGMDDNYPLLYQAKVWCQSGGVLWELINFSDCEGVIDHSTCKKIYGDLQMLDIALIEENYLSKYYDLMSACKVASESNGVLVFG